MKMTDDKLIKAVKSHYARAPRNQSAFVNLRSFMGNGWATYYCVIGAPQAGKSYTACKLGLNLKRRLGDNVKWYWFRLSETSTRKLLQDNAGKLIDADLARKFNLRLKTCGPDVWRVDDEGNRLGSLPLVTVLPLSTVYSDKGTAYFDKDFDGEYYIIFDEMNRDTYAGEKVTFDITYNFKRSLENVLRNSGSEESKAKRVRVVMLGNTMAEASDVLLSFGFMPNPGEFGRYKLRKQGLILDYLPLSDAYVRMRSGSAVDKIHATNESGFANEVEADMSLIEPRIGVRPTVVIKFSDSKSDWFTVWNNGVVRLYNKESIKTVIAMRRYIQNVVYSPESVRSVYERYDSRSFKYYNYYTYVAFRHALMKLKPQR